MLGGAASITEIVKEHVVTKFALSLAVQVIVESPMEKMLPLANPTQDNEAIPEASEAVGATYVTFILRVLLLVGTVVTAGGQTSVGAVVSLIIIWKKQVETKLRLSVALHIPKVVPRVKLLPLVRLQPDDFSPEPSLAT
jgi:hypothetical protein